VFEPRDSRNTCVFLAHMLCPNWLRSPNNIQRFHSCGPKFVLALVAHFFISDAQQCPPCGTWDSPPPGETPMTHNGKIWPTKCINRDRGHIFTIGDWGSYVNYETFDNTLGGRKRPYNDTVDKYAQWFVADVFKIVASKSNPDYIINVGDNFYPGGVNTQCGARNMCTLIDNAQWRELFEQMYDSPELKGKEWHGVLGNHDYGGWRFNAGWDQSVAYTWHSEKWLTPALYWERKVQYCDFSVDYYFIDTNNFDAYPPNSPNQHTNICSEIHNSDFGGSDCSSVQGPRSPTDCFHWFWAMWREQVQWLEDRLSKSTAEWQIVVTHFPPQWGAAEWRRLSNQYGIDLFITGHRHQQEFHFNDVHLDLGGTAWIVSGGGGGVTSEGYPLFDTPLVQQYGFMDLEITRNEITVDMWSWKNRKHSSNKVRRRLRPDEKPIPTPTPTFKWTRPIPDSCADMGCNTYRPNASCQCNQECTVNSTCCADFDMCSMFFSVGTHASPSRTLIADRKSSASRLATCKSSRRRGYGSEHRRRADHYQANCWEACGSRGGYCEFCGEGNACCRSGSRMDPPECRDARFPRLQGKGHHQCIEPVGRHSRWSTTGRHEGDNLEAVQASLGYQMPFSDLSAERCLDKCGNKFGYCEGFCGTDHACCVRGSPNQPAECQTSHRYLYLSSGLDQCVFVERSLSNKIAPSNDTGGSATALLVGTPQQASQPIPTSSVPTTSQTLVGSWTSTPNPTTANSLPANSVPANNLPTNSPTVVQRQVPTRPTGSPTPASLAPTRSPKTDGSSLSLRASFLNVLVGILSFTIPIAIFLKFCKPNTKASKKEKQKRRVEFPAQTEIDANADTVEDRLIQEAEVSLCQLHPVCSQNGFVKVPAVQTPVIMHPQLSTQVSHMAPVPMWALSASPGFASPATLAPASALAGKQKQTPGQVVFEQRGL